MLRTLIEQWARITTKTPRAQREQAPEPTEKNWKADIVLDVYAETLPGDLKGRFGTLKETYGELSEDINSATGAPEVFDKARAEIDLHSDARRMFRL